MVLWTEKYRPKLVDAFEGPEYLKLFLNAKDKHPNLMLHGLPGTGKTTFAHLLSTKKLELNASDERGISTIREKIKTYAFSLQENKTIILDECDSLTPDAQHCLRRIIEDAPHTRFIFITNYPSKIIDSLKSRLISIRFKACDSKVLEDIGFKEGLEYDHEWYCNLFKLCNNDLRRSINVLQGVAPLSRFCIEDIVGIVPKHVINNFWETNKSRIIQYVKNFLREGYSVMQLIYQLNDFNEGDEKQMAEFHLLLSMLESKLLIGCSDEVIMYNLLSEKSNIFNN